MKRFVDLFFAGFGLLVTLPFYPIIGLCIVADSPGPIFFRQTRIGRHGRPFKILKFRSMQTVQKDGGPRFDAGDTSRVTKVGGFLRNTKLDELPQLINVLRGEMSIVGPRPEIPKWVDVYPKRWREVLTVRPGITDPASIEFRSEEKILAGYADPEEAYKDIVLPQKLTLYEDYVRNQTIVGDLQILVRTIILLIMR